MKEIRREISDSYNFTDVIIVRIAIPDGEGGTIEANGTSRMNNGKGWVQARYIAATFARRALDPSHQWAARCRYCGNAARKKPECDPRKAVCNECYAFPSNRPNWPTGDPDLAALAGVAGGPEKSGDSPG